MEVEEVSTSAPRSVDRADGALYPARSGGKSRSKIELNWYQNTRYVYKISILAQLGSVRRGISLPKSEYLLESECSVAYKLRISKGKFQL